MESRDVSTALGVGGVRGWHSETLEGTADLEGDKEKPGVMGAPGEGTGKLEGRGGNCSSSGMFFLSSKFCTICRYYLVQNLSTLNKEGIL